MAKYYYFAVCTKLNLKAKAVLELSQKNFLFWLNRNNQTENSK